MPTRRAAAANRGLCARAALPGGDTPPTDRAALCDRVCARCSHKQSAADRGRESTLHRDATPLCALTMAARPTAAKFGGHKRCREVAAIETPPELTRLGLPVTTARARKSRICRPRCAV